MESVSNMDVICADKTGRLTTGRLSLAAIMLVWPLTPGDVERSIGSMARRAGWNSWPSPARPRARHPGLHSVPLLGAGPDARQQRRPR